MSLCDRCQLLNAFTRYCTHCGQRLRHHGGVPSHTQQLEEYGLSAVSDAPYTMPIALLLNQRALGCRCPSSDRKNDFQYPWRLLDTGPDNDDCFGKGRETEANFPTWFYPTGSLEVLGLLKRTFHDVVEIADLVDQVYLNLLQTCELTVFICSIWVFLTACLSIRSRTVAQSFTAFKKSNGVFICCNQRRCRGSHISFYVLRIIDVVFL